MGRVGEEPAGGGVGADSVLGALPRFVWSSAVSVRYEVALEMLAQQMAACTARIEALGQGDVAGVADGGVVVEVEQLQQLRSSLARRQRELDPGDPGAVQVVLAAAAEDVARIAGGL